MARDGTSRSVLTTAQKLERKQRLLDLAVDMSATQTSIQSKVAKIREEYGRTNKWIRSQLLLAHSRRRRRGPSAWNAFVQKKLSEFNKSLTPGQKPKRLTQYLSTHSTELKDEYAALSVAERKHLLRDINIAQVERVKIVRSNPKALLRKYNGTFGTMKKDWTTICRDLGVEGFYVVVRGSVEDFHQPEVFVTEKALSFLAAILKMTPEALALKLEAFVVSGLADNIAPTVNDNMNRTRLVSKCRADIQKGLNDILAATGQGEHPKTRRVIKVVMNYERYEEKIVRKHRVALDGWPFDEVINPGLLSSKENVLILANALDKGDCKWIKVTDMNEETGTWKSRGYRKKGNATSSSIIDDEEDSEDDD